MADKVFGIDLGTTYSCISHIDKYGRPEVITNLDNEPTTPSVVLFDTGDQVVVGKEAKRQARISPDVVATLVKRQMGDSEWRFHAHDKDWSAPAVASLILSALAADAKAHTGTEVTDVVITVPAYFGDEERKATRLAGSYAGLNVVDIVNEPTAAAFAYGFAQTSLDAGVGGEETVLVYDLGGGTFDITVIRLSGKLISVVATDGDHALGGADWDARIATHLAERFTEAAPGAEDPLDDSYGAQDLITSAEEVKQTLTLREEAQVLVVHGGHRANIVITRSDLEELTSSLLERTIQLTRLVLSAAAARGAERIDRVLLVGGSAKMPAVARRLREEFGFDPQLTDPDLAVAKGAAIYGQKKQFERVVIEDLVAQGKLAEGQDLGDAEGVDLAKAIDKIAEDNGLPSDSVGDLVGTEVQNVCSRGFGVLVQNAEGQLEATFLTHRNDRLPLIVTDEFYTVTDDQTEVLVEVFEQGGNEESTRPEDNNLLISGTIAGIPPGHARGSLVTITFSMGASGMLDVTARHSGVDRSLSLKVDTSASLDDATVRAEQGQVSLLKPKR